MLVDPATGAGGGREEKTDERMQEGNSNGHCWKKSGDERTESGRRSTKLVVNSAERAHDQRSTESVAKDKGIPVMKSKKQRSTEVRRDRHQGVAAYVSPYGLTRWKTF